MRLAIAFSALGILSDPPPGLADETPPGTVRVASRLFLVGEAPSEATTLEDFLPLTEVRWFWHLAQDDPVLDGAVVHIEQPPSPPAYLFGPDSTLARLHSVRDRVPDAFQAEGYVSFTTEGDGTPNLFLFRPDVPEADFLVTCGTDDTPVPSDRFLLCVLRASYPLDPAIMLQARLYFPPPFAELHGRFEPIAARLREIALCLDVTDSPPEDPQAALAALLAANPTLEGCEDRLSS